MGSGSVIKEMVWSLEWQSGQSRASISKILAIRRAKLETWDAIALHIVDKGCIFGWRYYKFANFRVWSKTAVVPNLILYRPGHRSAVSFDDCYRRASFRLKATSMLPIDGRVALLWEVSGDNKGFNSANKLSLAKNPKVMRTTKFIIIAANAFCCPV